MSEQREQTRGDLLNLALGRADDVVKESEHRLSLHRDAMYQAMEEVPSHLAPYVSRFQLADQLLHQALAFADACGTLGTRAHGAKDLGLTFDCCLRVMDLYAAYVLACQVLDAE